MMLKIFSVVMLAVGEALCIYSEMLVAKKPDWLWTFFLITLAGVPLLLGYHYGYKAFGSMWAVMAVSILTILLVEPLLVWTMFRELPSRIALISLLLGAVGLVLLLFEE
jgi:drug/metabolite transporter (DMT)-like permease